VELRGTSDEEITAFMDAIETHKGGPTFGGVFSNDKLIKPAKNKVYILNLENSNEGGSHWTLLYDGHYFDSYGVAPTKRISQFVKTFNQYDYQGLSDEWCGHFAMYVGARIIAGMTPWTGDLIPGKIQHNEDLLETFFYGDLLK
jgi:hypothetical protein